MSQNPPLCLFPLPTLLVPGALLPLYIFEERYQLMLRDVLAGDHRFGIVFHDPDLHGPFMNESGSIGCKVEVVRHKPEEDGHAWIGVRGVERFRILEEVPGMPYYRAYTETFSDQGPAASPQRRNRTFSLFQEVVEHLGGEEVDEETILGEPDLSFALARTLKIQPSWIEAFLELREEDQRLSELDTVFRAVLLRETEEGDS